MSSVSAASSLASTTTTDNTTARITQQTLGESDFLKLLTTQMSNQDPMNPTSDTDQIAQLAQFSSLQSMNSLLTTSQLQGASSVIGKNVTAADASGNSVSGTVDSAQISSGVVYVTINGTQYAYSTITNIQPAATTAATTTTTQ